MERLSSVGRLLEWLRQEDLLPTQPPKVSDLSRARRLRELLRPVGLAAAVGQAARADEVDELNAVLDQEPRPQLRLDVAQLSLSPPSTTSAALSRIARHAAEHLTGPEAGRLRTCDDPECGMLFLDRTGRRRWCSAEICGVRHRVRAHRSRRSTTTDETTSRRQISARAPGL